MRSLQTEPIHPATGEPTNAARGDRVAAALADYSRYTRETDPATIVQDFLTDTLHYAHQQNLDTEALLRRASSMFEVERQAES